VRGSPIRKSSDQRSVDSSPRLIAASYVLHRLLVPRHPPCALNNLTTQTPTPTHNKTPDPPPGKPGAALDQRGYPVTCLQKLARCSRPLCSSQSTESRSTSPTARPRQPGRYDEHEALREETVARSLRTQQRAYNHRTTHDPVPDPSRGAVLGTRHSRRPNWSAFHPRAPSPTPAGVPEWNADHGRCTALDQPPGTNPDLAGQCSLERR
jgi:hypothetical protein